MDEVQATIAFAALAHPARHRIFMLVATATSACVCLRELSDAFGLSDAALVIHTTQLERAGLLTSQRCEGEPCWRLNRDSLAALIGTLSGTSDDRGAGPEAAARDRA